LQTRREFNKDSSLIYAPNEQTTPITVTDGIGGAVAGKITN